MTLQCEGRSLRECARRGWIADIVERRITRKLTRDFLGCVDLIALDGQPGALAIQATSRSNMAARLKKAKAEPRLRFWLEAGNRFEVWGWGETKPRGAKKASITLRTIVVKLGDLG